MPTLKRKNANGQWEYIQVSGLDVSQLKDEVDSVMTSLAESASKLSSVVSLEQYSNLIPNKNTIFNPTQWDWTIPLQTAINDIKNSNNEFKTLVLSGRDYMITQQIVIDFPLCIQGVYNSRKYYSANGGSKLVDYTTGSEPFIKFYTATGLNSDGRIWGGIKLTNIHIDGRNNQHDGIQMIKTAWEMDIESVYIENFGGRGLYCDTVYDSNVRGLTIYRCGGMSVDSVIQYALELGASAGDCTNAIHFFGLHIERCRYMLKLGSSRHNQFIGCKFEAFEDTTITSDLTNPYIWVDGVSAENQFIGTMFIPPRAQDWITLGYATNLTQIPYFISLIGTADPHITCVIFQGCPITSPPPSGGVGGGAKVANSGTGTFKFDNCHIDFLNGGDYGLYLSKESSLTNCKIGVQVSTDNKAYGVRLDNSTAIGNTFKVYNPTFSTTVTDTAILASNGSIISENRYVSFTNKVVGDVGTVNVMFRRKRSYVKLTEALYMSLHGLSSINYSDVTLDLTKFDSTHFGFEFNSNFTLNRIIGGFDCDEVIIHNNKGGVVMTVAHGNSTITNSKLILNHSANATINPEELMLLKFTGWEWSETGRRNNT